MENMTSEELVAHFFDQTDLCGTAVKSVHDGATWYIEVVSENEYVRTFEVILVAGGSPRFEEI